MKHLNINLVLLLTMGAVLTFPAAADAEGPISIPCPTGKDFNLTVTQGTRWAPDPNNPPHTTRVPIWNLVWALTPEYLSSLPWAVEVKKRDPGHGQGWSIWPLRWTSFVAPPPSLAPSVTQATIVASSGRCEYALPGGNLKPGGNPRDVWIGARSFTGDHYTIALSADGKGFVFTK